MSKSIEALMFTPVMPMPQSFFSTSGALMPMLRARSATVIVSSMRMTRLCSAGVVSVVCLPFLPRGSFLRRMSLRAARATAAGHAGPRCCCCCANRPRIGFAGCGPGGGRPAIGVRSVILMRGGSAMTCRRRADATDRAAAALPPRAARRVLRLDATGLRTRTLGAARARALELELEAAARGAGDFLDGCAASTRAGRLATAARDDAAERAAAAASTAAAADARPRRRRRRLALRSDSGASVRSRTTICGPVTHACAERGLGPRRSRRRLAGAGVGGCGVRASATGPWRATGSGALSALDDARRSGSGARRGSGPRGARRPAAGAVGRERGALHDGADAAQPRRAAGAWRGRGRRRGARHAGDGPPATGARGGGSGGRAESGGALRRADSPRPCRPTSDGEARHRRSHALRLRCCGAAPVFSFSSDRLMPSNIVGVERRHVIVHLETERTDLRDQVLVRNPTSLAISYTRIFSPVFLAAVVCI